MRISKWSQIQAEESAYCTCKR